MERTKRRIEALERAAGAGDDVERRIAQHLAYAVALSSQRLAELLGEPISEAAAATLRVGTPSLTRAEISVLHRSMPGIEATKRRLVRLIAAAAEP